MPDAEETGAHPLDGRVRKVEDAITLARGVALVVGALLSVCLGGVCAGAMATRDATLAQGARLTSLESRSSSEAATREHREDAERAARDQLIEIRSDLRALRAQVEELDRHYQRANDSRPVRALPR